MKSFFSKVYYRIIGDLSLYMQMSGNGKKAYEYCEAAVKNGADSVNALNLYGVICLQNGNAKDALLYLKKARELNKKPVMEKRLVVSIGCCHWLLGDVQKGIEAIESLIGKYDYLNPDVYTTLGFLHLLNNDSGKALFYTNEALNANEKHAPAYDNLGQIYYKEQNYKKAKENFFKALELNANMTDSKYYLGLIFEEEEDFESASSYFKSAQGDYVNSLNTVTKQQIDEKCHKYFSGA